MVVTGATIFSHNTLTMREDGIRTTVTAGREAG
jgi:hypothetical protein